MEHLDTMAAPVPTTPEVANTRGTIAKRYGVSVDAVDYCIRSRGFQPIMVAGHFKIFDEATAQAIGRELTAIRAVREGGAE